MDDAANAPDTQALDDSVQDLPLNGQPATEAPANQTTEPAADTGTDDAAAAQGQDDKPADDPKPDGGTETPPSGQPGDKPADDNGQPENAQQDLTPEERNRLAAEAFRNRQRTRANVENTIDQNYAAKSQQDFEDEGYEPAQAQIEALRAEMAYKEQRTQIAELNAGLQSDAVNIVHDMPVFDPNSKEFDAAFTQQVEAAYKTAARVQADQNGIVLNAEVPLYDFYKQMHDIYSRGNTTGALSQQQANAAMLAATEEPGGSSTTSKGPETLDDMEARLGDVVIAG
jgi:hypothetical protein